MSYVMFCATHGPQMKAPCPECGSRHTDPRPETPADQDKLRNAINALRDEEPDYEHARSQMERLGIAVALADAARDQREANLRSPSAILAAFRDSWIAHTRDESVEAISIEATLAKLSVEPVADAKEASEERQRFLCLDKFGCHDEPACRDRCALGLASTPSRTPTPTDAPGRDLTVEERDAYREVRRRLSTPRPDAPGDEERVEGWAVPEPGPRMDGSRAWRFTTKEAIGRNFEPATLILRRALRSAPQGDV